MKYRENGSRTLITISLMEEVNNTVLEHITKGDWKRFVQEGVLNESRINKRVAASWNHCKRLGVDPYNGKGTQLLSAEELKMRRKENSRLLGLAEPFIKKLAALYQDSNVVLLLVDRDGYVLRMVGENRVKTFAENINFTEGVKWTEEQVGTNAIGTALAIGEPICINGMEHFSIASQNWGCSASPIKDENGEVIGALDISSPYVHEYHEHLLATVVSAAYAIETNWKNRMKEEELALINYGIKEEKENSDFFILFNRNNHMVYMSSSISKPIRKQLESIKDFPKSFNKYPVFSSESNDIIGHRMCWPKDLNSPIVPGWNHAFKFHGISGKSYVFQSVLKRAAKAAQSNVTIHISGETGTGKEVMARSIHDHKNSSAPFVAVNCGALPEDLLESELFGYVQGAFTGAQKGGYEGKIVQANGGTLFLDEIGDISPKTQVALLRTLQDKQVVPIGGKKPIPVTFQLITATNKSLGELVKKGTFREDLYYRIYVYLLQMPPLRERLEDIPDLIRYYFQKRNWSYNWTDQAVLTLQNYHWPGNIRELFNVLEVLYTENYTSSPDVTQIEAYIRQITPYEYRNPQSDSLSYRNPQSDSLSYREQMEKNYIEKALQQHGGRASAAAQQLGIPRSTFYRKLKKYKIDK